MNPEPLPPGLRDLEERLARRPCPEPAADFRSRVLGAMTNAGALPAPEGAGPRWRLAWRAAAAVVLALNLAMCAANAVRFQRLSGVAVAGDFERRPPVPDAFDAADRLQRFAARALANLAPAPDAGALGRRLFSNEEEREWALP